MLRVLLKCFGVRDWAHAVAATKILWTSVICTLSFGAILTFHNLWSSVLMYFIVKSLVSVIPYFSWLFCLQFTLRDTWSVFKFPDCLWYLTFALCHLKKQPLQSRFTDFKQKPYSVLAAWQSFCKQAQMFLENKSLQQRCDALML